MKTEESAYGASFGGVGVTIRVKILLVFIVSMLVYLILASAMSISLLDQSTKIRLRQSAQQSSDLLVSGIRSALENARNLSYNLLLNADITDWINDVGGADSIAATRRANQVLIQTYATFRGIESIHIFNNDGKYISGSQHRMIQSFGDIRETSWYKRASELRGGFFVTLNADGTLFSSTGNNNISMVRQILDMSSLTPKGFLIVNLNDVFLANTVRDMSDKYGTNYYVLTASGESILKEQQPPSWNNDIAQDGDVRAIDGETLFLYKTGISELGWTVLSSARYAILNILPYSVSIIIVPMMCAVAIFTMTSAFTAKLITKPVNMLITAMQGVRYGRFDPIAMKPKRRDEFGQLGENFNIMIAVLNNTIRQRVLLENEKKRYELDIITEQFKPHFLYNTLDSISWLVLSGDNKRAHEAILSMSRFYRACLHKGKELVPLSRELDAIQSYLTLQKIRYGEMIRDSYDISKEAQEELVLHNILQPLVENCIYHGIKPSGEPGRIKVSAWIEDGRVRILTEDDGIGMTKETLRKINDPARNSTMASFGLRGTIQRMTLFYGIKDVCEITSAPGEGTKALLKLPVQN